jgi:hypothetical protein
LNFYSLLSSPLLDKFIYKKVMIDNSSKAEVDDYIENEKMFESKESDWMTKSIFREELKLGNKSKGNQSNQSNQNTEKIENENFNTKI